MDVAPSFPLGQEATASSFQYRTRLYIVNYQAVIVQEEKVQRTVWSKDIWTENQES